jgi:hypothetical protein
MRPRKSAETTGALCVPISSGAASVAVTRRRMKEMTQCPSEPSRGPPMLATAGRRDMSWKDAGDGRHASCPATGTWSAPGSSSLRLSKRMNELSWARMSAVLGFQSSSLAEPPLPRHWTLVVYGRGAIRENSRTRARRASRSLELRDRGQHRGRLQAPRPAPVPFLRDLVWLWSHVLEEICRTSSRGLIRASGRRARLRQGAGTAS